MSKGLVLAAGGIAAGFINGLLGTGGGIVLVFMLGMLYKKENEKKDIFANVLMVTSGLSVVSLFVYLSKGEVEVSPKTLTYALSAILGGFLGAYLLDRLEVGFVKKLFCFLVIFAGLNMAGVF